MRLAVMGTGPFIVPTFRSLIESDHQIACLVTQPVPQRRSKTPPPNPTRVVGEQHNIPILDPPSINDEASIESLRQLDCDLFVVCDYGQILSAAALASSRLGGINLHGSLLPKFRGAAPVQWAILAGESQTGVSVIHMTPKLDAGPCLCQSSLDIRPGEAAGELEARLAVLGVDSVQEAITMLADWDGQATIGTIQDPSLATRAPRLKKQDGAIDWTQPAEVIERSVRAFQPWPGSFTFWLDGPKQPLRLIIVQATTVDSPLSLDPGIIHCEDDHLDIGTGSDILRLLSVKPAGKRAMSSAEFTRGHRIESGQRFGPG